LTASEIASNPRPVTNKLSFSVNVVVLVLVLVAVVAVIVVLFLLLLFFFSFCSSSFPCSFSFSFSVVFVNETVLAALLSHCCSCIYSKLSRPSLCIPPLFTPFFSFPLPGPSKPSLNAESQGYSFPLSSPS
jgi:hypothetical protein